MPTPTAAPDVPLSKLRRLRELQERRKQLAPVLFRRTWRCDREDCDGKPHDGWPKKHARSSQIIPWGGTVEIEDVENPGTFLRIFMRIFYLVGGRGSGKTWAGARNFAQMVLETVPDDDDDFTVFGVVGPTYKDCRDTLIEGGSGLIRALGGYERDGGYVAKWDRSYGHLHLTTGTLIFADSANDGGQRIQGKNLYGAWCDEIGLWKSWQRTWNESLLLAVRKGEDHNQIPARIICTGTPKRSSLAKVLLTDPTVGRRRLRTVENIDNLARDAVRWLLARFQGTTLGKQELEGELVDDVEGALWRRDNIDADRVAEHKPAFWRNVVVSLDPSDGLEDGDEQGLCELALSAENHELYVLESEGLRMTPWDFLSHAVDRCLSYQPTVATLVLEKNHGGQYLVGLLEQVLKAKGVRVPYHVVDAGGTTKRTRAEQVSGLYQQHKVHHVGHFADLEDQMCLSGDALVSTEYGDLPIASVVAGDRVWTRSGLRRVSWAGKTGEEPVWTLRTDGPRSLRATASHPVLSGERGFVPLRSLQPGERVVTWAEHRAAGRLSSTRASDTTSTGSDSAGTTAHPDPAAARCSTGLSGPRPTATPLRAGTSITAITTRPTTGSRTSSPSARRITPRRMTRAAGLQILLLLVNALRSGDQSGRVGGPGISPALSAEAHSPPPARERPTAPPAVTSERVVAVEGPWRAEPVYNLTVEGEPEFFANGVLVHNCTWTGLSTTAAGGARHHEPSPDRMDALVWALTYFVFHALGTPPMPAEQAVVPWGSDDPTVTGVVQWEGSPSDVFSPPAPPPRW